MSGPDLHRTRNPLGSSSSRTSRGFEHWFVLELYWQGEAFLPLSCSAPNFCPVQGNELGGREHDKELELIFNSIRVFQPVQTGRNALALIF